MLHDSGLNFTYAMGQDLAEGRDDDPHFHYLKLGYIADFFDIGETALAVDFGRVLHISADGDAATTFGGYLVQNLAEYGAQFYVGTRSHELDRPGNNYDDIWAVLGGARMKF